MVYLEFIVLGPPVSHQTKDRANLAMWKATVKAAAASTWRGTSPLAVKLKFLLINFHEGDDPPMDDDNMVKPIRDALNGFVYDDDSQIRHSETIHFPIDGPLRIRGASMVLLTAFSTAAEFLYVRVEDAPATIQLPK